MQLAASYILYTCESCKASQSASPGALYACFLFPHISGLVEGNASVCLECSQASVLSGSSVAPSVVLQSGPPKVMATSACHVVTAAVFLDLYMAPWTLLQRSRKPFFGSISFIC